MDAAIIGALIGFGIVVSVPIVCGAYKCYKLRKPSVKKPLLPIYSEPKPLIAKKHATMRRVFSELH